MIPKNITAGTPESWESIAKAHEFSRKSINELRKAVAILKDQSVNSQIELGELLNDMIESLETSGKLKFTLNFDKEVENSSQDMKNCMYNSVREGPSPIANKRDHAYFIERTITIAR
ncbi:hypothetical protein [Neobacillus cucumis]|uniref:hypothetical protein n=1 Tax=Neobacillus cucumis TaxID=1740721 RepID=UPI0028532840|nr:hypothetical protein [Neobacillus cucumis]MDR4945452.1 hypothetical protein [Neobacillus cucumis]